MEFYEAILLATNYTNYTNKNKFKIFLEKFV